MNSLPFSARKVDDLAPELYEVNVSKYADEREVQHLPFGSCEYSLKSRILLTSVRELQSSESMKAGRSSSWNVMKLCRILIAQGEMAL